MPSEYVKRIDLYAEVWLEPMGKVAKRYGISDVALAKACRKADIPLPPFGYWAKLAANKAPPKVQISHTRFTADSPVHLRRPEDHEFVARERAESAMEAARTALAKLHLPTALHPLASKTAKRLSQETGWSDPKGLRSAPSEVLNLAVTSAAVDRGCQLFSKLIHTFGAIGGEILVDSGETILRLNGSFATAELSEHVGRSKHVRTAAEESALTAYWKASRNPLNQAEYPRIPDYDYTPSGRLTLKIGSWPSRTWSDTPRRRLEERIDEIVSGAIILLAETRVKAEDDARKAAKRAQAKANYEALVQAKTNERTKLQALRREAAARVRAIQIRQYVEEVRTSAETNGPIPPELAEWIAWALARADWVDPMIRVSDPVLDAPLPTKPLWGW